MWLLGELWVMEDKVADKKRRQEEAADADAEKRRGAAHLIQHPNMCVPSSNFGLLR